MPASGACAFSAAFCGSDEGIDGLQHRGHVGAGNVADLEFDHGAIRNEIERGAAMQRADMDGGVGRLECAVACAPCTVLPASSSRKVQKRAAAITALAARCGSAECPPRPVKITRRRDLALMRVDDAQPGRLADDAQGGQGRKLRHFVHQIGRAEAADLFVVGQRDMNRRRAGGRLEMRNMRRARRR